MKYYKVLGKGRGACNGGSGKWPRRGTWLEAKGPLAPCQNGLHLCRLKDLVFWLNGEIWEVEPAPGTETIVCDNKVVVRKARLVKQIKEWNEKTARLFAADCAEHVLSIYEKKYPDDDRPRNAIEAVRKYANGKITREELDAVGDSAWAAAWAAVGDSAWDAAGDAVGTAARAAAWAAWGGAAWAAARDAAWAAALAAAWNSAWAAVGDSAWDAARAAEGKWQTERQAYYLGIGVKEGA